MDTTIGPTTIVTKDGVRNVCAESYDHITRTLGIGPPSHWITVHALSSGQPIRLATDWIGLYTPGDFRRAQPPHEALSPVHVPDPPPE
jgi:hypothetical protein